MNKTTTIKLNGGWLKHTHYKKVWNCNSNYHTKKGKKYHVIFEWGGAKEYWICINCYKKVEETWDLN